MKKILTLLAILASLSSCSVLRVHKMDIEQGNIITSDQTAKLHKGMSEEQVVGIMGTPMLSNTFTNNRVDYVYTYKPGYGDVQEKHVTLIFRNGALADIKGSMYPQTMS